MPRLARAIDLEAGTQSHSICMYIRHYVTIFASITDGSKVCDMSDISYIVAFLNQSGFKVPVIA